MNAPVFSSALPGNSHAQGVTMTSREIADLVGSRHDKVKQSIERLATPKRGAIAAPIDLPPVGEYLDTLGRPAAEYIFAGDKGKRDSIVVVAQLSPEFTAALVDRWQQLEQQLAVRAPLALPDFSSPAEAARAWAEQYELREAANQALAIAAPKAAFVDRFVVADGLYGLRQVAKMLRANEREFGQWLQDAGIMYRLGGRLTPCAAHLNTGRFEVKAGASGAGRAFTQSKFTAKGFEWVAGKWAARQLAHSAAGF